MTSNQMVGFAFSDDRVSTASLFSSVDSYMSYYLTPEAAEFLSELKGFKGAYTESINPAAYIELFKLLKLSLSNKYQRPLKGMSAIINALVVSVRNCGGKLYAESEVLVIKKDETKFILRTMNLTCTVFTNKIAIATHPVAYMKVKGGVSEEIHRDSVFQSIKIMPAFKGAAVYRDAWWEKSENVTRNITLEPRQRFVSSSNCMGVTMPYGSLLQIR